MYIGPWQEYKLAQVIKTKNDLYELKSNLASDPSIIRNSHLSPLGHLSNVSNISTFSPLSILTLPRVSQVHNSAASLQSTRTISSEPVQRPYPKFSIDNY